MLTSQVLDQFSEIRRRKQSVICEANFNDMNLFHNLVCWELQYCDLINVSPQTKYLSKIYLSHLFSAHPNLSKIKMKGFAVCCVWVASKFNESRQFSDNLTINVVIQHSNNQMNTEQMFEVEAQLLQILEFKTIFITPYDYISPFFQTYPWMQHLKKIVENLISFSLTILQTNYFKVEEIFYACFLVLASPQLNEIQKRVIQANSDDWEAVQKLARIIKIYYKQTMKRVQ